jgi:hypothetical protein
VDNLTSDVRDFDGWPDEAALQLPFEQLPFEWAFARNAYYETHVRALAGGHVVREFVLCRNNAQQWLAAAQAQGVPLLRPPPFADQ